MRKTIGFKGKRKSAGIKRKGGFGRNSHEQVIPNKTFHGNGKEDSQSLESFSVETSPTAEMTNKTPDLLPPTTMDDPVAVVQDALMPAPQTKNTTTFNNPTPTPVTSFIKEGHTLFRKMFDIEQLLVEK
jgi:hypothetical protein